MKIVIEYMLSALLTSESSVRYLFSRDVICIFSDDILTIDIRCTKRNNGVARVLKIPLSLDIESAGVLKLNVDMTKRI